MKRTALTRCERSSFSVNAWSRGQNTPISMDARSTTVTVEYMTRRTMSIKMVSSRQSHFTNSNSNSRKMTIQIVVIISSNIAMMRIKWMDRMMKMTMKCTCRFILILSLRRTKWA